MCLYTGIAKLGIPINVPIYWHSEAWNTNKCAYILALRSLEYQEICLYTGIAKLGIPRNMPIFWQSEAWNTKKYAYILILRSMEYQ